MSDTLDTKGAADLLHISTKLTQKLAQTGEVPAVYLAGQWLFPKAELLSWLTDRAREEQRMRREQALAAAEIPKPVRGPGRPRKVVI